MFKFKLATIRGEPVMMLKKFVPMPTRVARERELYEGESWFEYMSLNRAGFSVGAAPLSEFSNIKEFTYD